jgi:sugar/nucleoside kinase (ribokinase family)
MSLLVIGTVAFDAIETPFGKTDKIIGGAATYIGLSASYYTKNINLVSVVGSDFPVSAIEMMNKKGINTEGLEIKRDGKTFFWSGKYHIDMNTRDTLDTQLNVLMDFDPVVPESQKNCEFLMLGNLMPTIQRKVIEQIPVRPKLIVMDTMNFWMESMMDELLKTIAMVDVLTINDEEARLLTNEYSLVKAAQKILTLGPKYLIIKKGEHGALLFNNKQVFFAPALPLEDVFDPTGAGDTFAGGFIGYIVKSRDVSFDNMKRAIIYGSAMASFCVEKFGIENLLDLSDEQVENRVQDFIDLVQFDIALVN